MNWINLKPPLNVHLYKEPSQRSLDLTEITNYLRDKLGNISVDLRGPFFTEAFLVETDFVKGLARARVYDFSTPHANHEPSEEEVEIERELLLKPHSGADTFYDGFKLQVAAREQLQEEERGIGHAHIIFTSRFFGTWDETDRRYHPRVCILGYPNIISTVGLVEAPARPREYYALKRKYQAQGEKVGGELEIFREKIIDYDDPRLTEVLKGYAMQAIFYHLTLDPFCGEPHCRLFNSHWQEEIIRAQLSAPEFCSRHQRILDEWKEKFSQ